MKIPQYIDVLLSLFTIFLLPHSVQGQYPVLDSNDVEHLVDLPEQLPEVSGIILTPYNTIIGHNDRGHKARLYEFDMKTGEKIRTIEVENAKNRDWEDIASDSKYIYIADVGNNRGKREKLKIYRIKWPDKGSKRITAVAEKIRFIYADQSDFEERKSHNYDCEAIIALDDSLYLFTKNRGDHRTNVCALAKEPGEYVIRVSQTFDVDGLVTGADIIGPAGNRILSLIGYNKEDKKYKPFIWTFTGFEGTKYFSGNATRVNLPLYIQAEGIHFFNRKKVLITNEEEKDVIQPALYQIKVKSLLSRD